MALPPSKSTTSVDPVDANRYCPTCGAEARIVSNFDGRRAFCGPCKKDWPISGAVLEVIPSTGARGLRKITLIEPNWEAAYEDYDSDSEYTPK